MVDEPLPEPERPSLITAWMEAGVALSLVATVAALFLFGWIANEMREGETLKFDLTVRGWVHQFASPGMTRAMNAISLLGYNVLIVELIAALAVFLFLRWRKAAGWLAISMGGALALDLALKYAYHRPRPEPFFGAAPDSFSFPSGHALCSFVFYAVVAGLVAARTRSLFLRMTAGVIAALLIGLIGLSRIYLGVHYPSDVIGGYLAAAMWVATLLVLDRWRGNRRKIADRRG